MGAAEGFPSFSGRDSKRRRKEIQKKRKEIQGKRKEIQGFFFEKLNVYTDLRDSLNRSIAAFA
jgi:hypothetical protein